MRTGEKSGIVLLNKSPGITSFQALNEIKKAFSTGKVGHTGTLDKFASGLLLVLVGRAVKLTPWFSGCDKEYEGVITFGVETDTLDPEGQSVAEAPPPDRETLEHALASFRGDILQAPPAYSAVHLGGERAHKLARSGAAVEMPKRPVSIYALDLLSYEPPLAKIRVSCSKGTYIRSLARDIALAADSRAHLSALNRTRIAGFCLAEASDPPGLGISGTSAESAASEDAADWAGMLKPVSPGVFAALNIPCMRADDTAVPALSQGKPLKPLMESGALRFDGTAGNADGIGSMGAYVKNTDGIAGIFDGIGNFIAVIEKKDAGIRTPGEVSPGGRWTYGYVYAGA